MQEAHVIAPWRNRSDSGVAWCDVPGRNDHSPSPPDRFASPGRPNGTQSSTWHDLTSLVAFQNGTVRLNCDYESGQEANEDPQSTNANQRDLLMHAVVIGAGPVGCLAATVLSQSGLSVTLIERRAGVARPEHVSGRRTIGLSISPRGMRALEQAGCGAAVRAVAVRMDRRVLHFGEDEHSTSLYSPGCWNFAVSRRDLNEVLLQSVLSRERVTAEFQAACKQIDLERKTVVMETPAGDVVQLGYDLLVGADGASSVVRDELEARGNLTVHRQVLPSAYKELTLNPASDAYPPSAIHIWPRNGFFLVGLPNLAGEFTGTLVMPAVGPGGFDELTESRVVREFVQRHFPGAVRRLERLDAEFGRNSVNRIATVSCSTMHYGDSVLLIGDAAHTVAPFLGQGINAGFEDCFVLQQLLHQYGTHLAHVLPRYTEERKDNADAVAALSMQNYAELSAGVRQRTDVVSLVNFSGLAYKDVLGRLAAHS